MKNNLIKSKINKNKLYIILRYIIVLKKKILIILFNYYIFYHSIELGSSEVS